MRKPILELVAKHLALDDNDCLIWTGATNERGYGYVGVQQPNGKQTTKRAHRVVFELLVGPIPEGLTLDHVQAWGCRSKRCCAPWHLEPVTRSENYDRHLGR